MKKQLLLGSALLSVLGAMAQEKRTVQPSGTVSLAEKLASKYEITRMASEKVSETVSVPQQASVKPDSKKKSSSSSQITWTPISASMNIFGVLLPDSKCLTYNDELNAVSFVHRKSPTYPAMPVPSPSPAAAGAIVAQISTDWGNTWDSTLIWNDNTYWARYPQGGIYNPPGNTSLANAHVVASGPITVNGGGWTGNFFASKPLSQMTNSVNSDPLAHRFIASTPPYDTIQKVDFARLDFSATDDGLVRSLGVIYDDPNGTTAAAQGFRGGRIIKGVYNSGHFLWTSDSISLASSGVNIGNDGSYDVIGGTVNMAWSESGKYGYLWFIGCRQGMTGSNAGFQPIVWKTTDHGANWVIMPNINFNDPSFQAPVLDHLQPVRTNTNLAIPFFNFREDISGVVDMNNNLHLVSTLWSSSSSHIDSLGYTWRFNNLDGETYSYPHVPGMRPYIYDFTSQSNGSWNVTIVDSMSSEAPGTRPQDDGYPSNPWDADPSNSNNKVSSSARIQASRTPNGRFILYSWAESDTNFTASGKKWNTMPNIKVRAMNVSSGTIADEEYDLTADADFNVRDLAHYHHVAPTSGQIATTATNFTLRLPTKITNSSPLQQLTTNIHWYSTVEMSFTRPFTVDPVDPGDTTVSISSTRMAKFNTVLYPNPAREVANLKLTTEHGGNAIVTVMNTMGQEVIRQDVKVQGGSNAITLNTSSLANGIYIVNVKLDGSSAKLKLLVE